MDTSKNNPNLIRTVYEVFGRGDIPAVLATMDENIVFQVAEGHPYGGTYHGHDAVVNNVFMRIGSEWEEYKVIPEELIDAGDIIVALGQYSGKYKATGKNMQAPFAHVWRIRNGKSYEFRQYTDTALIQRAVEGVQQPNVASPV